MAKITYDLSKFCESISHLPNARKFIALHKRWLGVLSQQQDLRTVAAYADEMLDIDETEDARRAGLLGGSITMSALVLYSRATHSDSPRSRVVVGNVLPEHLKIKHDHLIVIRNEVMAHFTGAKTSAGGLQWVEELGYLREGDGQPPAAGIAFKRANYLSQEINDLREIINFVGPIVGEEIQKRKTVMLAELQQLRNHEEIERALQATRFDLDAWLEREQNTEGSGIVYVRKQSA